jgi:hypothetical protein
MLKSSPNPEYVVHSMKSVDFRPARQPDPSLTPVHALFLKGGRLWNMKNW